jgi:ribosomal protein S1
MNSENINVSAEQEEVNSSTADINPSPVENAEILNSEPIIEPVQVENTGTPEVDNSPVAETPIAEVATELVAAVEVVSPAEAVKPVESAPIKDEAKQKEIHEKKEVLDAVFNELKQIKEQNGVIEVEVTSRIKGGLRVVYKNLQLFLPASHFTIKRTPTEEELQDSIGNKFKVNIHEVQELEEGRRAVIVTRKSLLVNEFWNSIEVGQIVKGKITSIASFGVFVDIGGVEGLIHVSRLSQVHVDDPAKLYKKGEMIEAKIVDINKETNKVALSHKELEPSPWAGIEEEFAIGSIKKGIVRRITDFGAYIELKPGIDGLLRTPEISWTKRIKHPGEVFAAGQEIDIAILAVNTEKQTVSLSYKQTIPNPWHEIATKYPIGTEVTGTIAQVMPQGVIISIGEEVDGFMPKSKIKSAVKGKKIPYEAGENIQVKVSDIVPAQESLIFEPLAEDNVATAPSRKNFSNENPKDKDAGAISFMDMLSENAKANLFNTMNK